MKIEIAGLELAHLVAVVPKNRVKTAEYVEGVSEKELDAISKLTGVSTIAICDDSTTSVDLAIRAAQSLPTDDVMKCQAIIFVSQTRDYLLPQSSFIIQNALGMDENTYCLDIPTGCSGYIYGLFQASLLLKTGIATDVLVLTADTNSKITNRKDKASASIFGDGASASILRLNGLEKSFIELCADGSGFDKLILKNGKGGFRNPKEDTREAFLREDGNLRNDSDIFMDGMAVMNFAVKRVPELIRNFELYSEQSLESFDYIFLHQANKFMIDYLRKKLKVEAEKVPVCMEGYGNTGPSSIPILMCDQADILNLKEKNKVLLSGFGVGLSWGLANLNLQNSILHGVIEY